MNREIQKLTDTEFRDLVLLSESPMFVILRQIFTGIAAEAQTSLNQRLPLEGNYTDHDFIAIGGERKLLDVNQWLSDLDIMVEKEAQRREYKNNKK